MKFGLFLKTNFLISILLIGSFIPPNDAKGGRGGGGGMRGGGGFGRGGSAARGSSGTKSGGGLFGGGISRSNSPPSRVNTGGGGFGRSNTGVGGGSWASGGNKGGIFGRNDDRRYARPSFTNTGIGSKSRSSAFKNAIVGAAAGYLTYQAAKGIIRNVASPMMWGGRPYYFGQQHYQSRGPSYQSCRMPISPNDKEFENIYLDKGLNRPHEIVWDCGVNEHCCGYECCPGGGRSNYGYYNEGMRGFGIGSFITLLILLCCGGFIIKRMCIDPARRNNNAYVSGNAQ
uniref:CX domain-containing protein n=1 Tax=Rhabditophanes sp. KR3021 TaxID=114890 RepID=A0AC35TRG5_9BILA